MHLKIAKITKNSKNEGLGKGKRSLVTYWSLLSGLRKLLGCILQIKIKHKTTHVDISHVKGPLDYPGREWRYRHQIFIFIYYLRLVFVIWWARASSLSNCLHTWIFSEFFVTICRRTVKHTKKRYCGTGIAVCFTFLRQIVTEKIHVCKQLLKEGACSHRITKTKCK